MATTIPVRTGQARYDVMVAPGALNTAGKYIAKFRPSKVIVVTSRKVRRHWGAVLDASLRSASLDHAVCELEDGEANKNLRTIGRLMQTFLRLGVDRSGLVVALGGGVIGDTAGFAASIFMRGIPIVQLPTTLLAQVDAAIGGKTGVNLPTGKNLVGTFHQPRLVLVDPEVLATQDDRNFRSGIFEVIKCAAIRDKGLFRYLEQHRAGILSRHPLAVAAAIEGAVKVKARIVRADERETDLRRVLNFGHTLGHAMEAATGYKTLLHGEAVAWGMVAAVEIGVNVGVTRQDDAERLIELIMSYGPLPPVQADAGRILAGVASDKKSIRGVPHFVLISTIGKTRIVAGIDRKIIRAAIEGISQT